MKRFSISTMLWSLLLLLVYSCEDLGVQPINEETATPLKITNVGPDMALTNIATGNKIILLLNYSKGNKDEKIEVNRHQATLNFDNHDPQIVRITAYGKMDNLKNFKAEENQLKEIPEVALNKGIKRIEVAHNKIDKFPDWRNSTPSTLKVLDISYNELRGLPVFKNSNLELLDISYNNLEKLPVFANSNLKLLDVSFNKKIKASYDELKKLNLPNGATLILTGTSIDRKTIASYIKKHPGIIVIYDMIKK